MRGGLGQPTFRDRKDRINYREELNQFPGTFPFGDTTTATAAVSPASSFSFVGFCFGSAL